MHIIGLEVHNVKRIRAARITPKGNLVVLEGRNKQGKTSVLDAIEMAFRGKRAEPKRPVHDGAEAARVVVETDEILVTRNWTDDNNSYLKVTKKSGAKVGSPQKYLDSLVGALAFDPVAFEGWKSTERLDMLRKLAGIDTEEEDGAHDTAFDRRRDLKKERDTYAKQFAGLGDVPEGVKVKPVAEIREKYDEAVAENAKIAKAKEDIPILEERFAEIGREIEENQRELARIADVRAKAQEIAHREYVDVEAMKTQLDQAQAVGAIAAKIEQAKTLRGDIAASDAELSECEEAIRAAKAAKRKKITEAKMPVEGLGFADGDITLDGREFSELSQAEKLRVALGMAMAEEPELRIVRILNGSLLDNESMAEIHSMAAASGFQVWIERVANGPSGDANAVYIEDGETKQ